MGAAPGGNADTSLIIPNGIFFSLNNKARAIGAIVLLQESRVFLQWLVFHKVGTDNQAAVLVIEADTQGFINDLLGKLGLGEEGLLFALLLRRKITAAQKGDLLLKTGRRYNPIYA